MGKHALLRTAESKAKSVSRFTVDEAMHEIALKGSAPTQEATYKSAIGHPYTRECILKKFASKTQDEIHTTEIYASLAREIGIELTAISVYMGHLTSEKYAPVLEKQENVIIASGTACLKRTRQLALGSSRRATWRKRLNSHSVRLAFVPVAAAI
ncbi:MAG: hypothetical protein IPO05_17180 [Flavobacteriales bacterium]|nr:hypothetical protein [Flavobacteriales bacterium]